MTPTVYSFFIRIHFMFQISKYLLFLFFFLHKSIFVALPQFVHLDIFLQKFKTHIINSKETPIGMTVRPF